MNITNEQVGLNSSLLALARVAERYRDRLQYLRDNGISPIDDERANELSQQLAMALDITKEFDSTMWGKLDGTL